MTDETRDALDEENQAPPGETDVTSEEATRTIPNDQGPALVEIEPAAAERASGREDSEPEGQAVDERPAQGQGARPETEPETALVENATAGERQEENPQEQEEAQESQKAAGDEGGATAHETQAAEQDDEPGAGQENLREPTAQEEEPSPTVKSVIEAILFATDEPLTEGKLASIIETTTKQVRESIKALNEGYERHNNAFRIEKIAGGHQMLTLGLYNNWLKKMLRVRSDTKLSPAAMETLAIIAYKQPIIRADVEAIRGVAVGEVIRSLMYKGLVKIVGRAEILGRPMLYGTTKKFLGIFGLNSLKDLPKAEDLKNPDRG